MYSTGHSQIKSGDTASDSKHPKSYIIAGLSHFVYRLLYHNLIFLKGSFNEHKYVGFNMIFPNV